MMRNTIGTICDPHTAWMLLRSLETVELRMSRAGENAATVCAFLKHHPKVEGLSYPGFLKEGPQLALFDRHRPAAGATFPLFNNAGRAGRFRFLTGHHNAAHVVRRRRPPH